MKRTSFITLCVALLMSCGYAAASPEPQRFAIGVGSGVSSHFYVHPGESVTVKVARELALVQWQHSVAQESRFSRSDMHASSGGLVFTVIQAEPEAVGLQAA